MRILFFITKREYTTALSREKYNILKEFVKYHEVLITGEGYDGFIDPITSCNEFKPTHIIVRYPQNIQNFDKLPSNIPKILWQNETYAISHFKDLLLKNHINFVFHAYHIRKGSKDGELQRQMFEEFTKGNCDISWLHMPHYFNGSAPKLKKEYDILILGNMVTGMYPHRYRLKNLLLKHQDIFKIKMRPHPSYTIQNSEKQYKDYLEEISKARIVIGCTSIFNYMLEKLIEIPMANSIYAGDMPYMDIYGEEEKSHMINLNFFWDDEKILKELKFWLENPEKLEEKSEKSHKFYKNKYNIDKGVTHLYNNLEFVSRNFRTNDGNTL